MTQHLIWIQQVEIYNQTCHKYVRVLKLTGRIHFVDFFMHLDRYLSVKYFQDINIVILEEEKRLKLLVLSRIH